MNARHSLISHGVLSPAEEAAVGRGDVGGHGGDAHELLPHETVVRQEFGAAGRVVLPTERKKGFNGS